MNPDPACHCHGTHHSVFTPSLRASPSTLPHPHPRKRLQAGAVVSREKSPGWRTQRRQRVTCQTGQARERPWQGHRVGAVKDELEGQPEAARGVVSWLKGPGPQRRPLGPRMEQAGLQGTGRGQGQTVSPRAPAAHGVPAGLELQAYPGEKGTERGLRGGISTSIRGWQDPQQFQARQPAPETCGFLRAGSFDPSDPGQRLTFMPSGPLSPGGPMSPGNP